MERILNEVIPKHNLSFNMDTYRILQPLRSDQEFINNISRNPWHNEVAVVLRRMAHIDAMINSRTYRAFHVIHGDALDLFPPDPILRMTDRHFRSLMEKWRKMIRVAVSWNLTVASQRELVQSMEYVLRRNYVHGLNLTTSSWNGFFHRFFELRNQYRGCYFCQLLGRMQGEGSYAKPDARTFGAILLGLATNEEIKNRETAIKLVLEDILWKHGVDADDLQSHGKIAVFWRIGRQIPLNDQDRIAFGSYEKLSALLGTQRRRVVSARLHEMIKIQSRWDTGRHDNINLMLYADNEGVLRVEKCHPDCAFRLC